MDRVEIAKATGGWSVQVRPWPEHDKSGAWWNTKVQHPKGKGGYWVAWNGRRFARTRQLEKLFNDNPELLGELHGIFSSWYRSDKKG